MEIDEKEIEEKINVLLKGMTQRKNAIKQFETEVVQMSGQVQALRDILKEKDDE